jgi:hypothetical protein
MDVKEEEELVPSQNASEERARKRERECMCVCEKRERERFSSIFFEAILPIDVSANQARPDRQYLNVNSQ